jgi:hypothetical protein
MAEGFPTSECQEEEAPVRPTRLLALVGPGHFHRVGRVDADRDDDKVPADAGLELAERVDGPVGDERADLRAAKVVENEHRGLPAEV